MVNTIQRSLPYLRIVSPYVDSRSKTWGTSYIKDRSGIAIERKDYIVIENNRLYDTFFGIYLKYVNHAIVRNNEIIGKAEFEAASGNAIQAWYSKNLTIENNQVSHHRDGIYFEFVDSSRVENNRSFEN